MIAFAGAILFAMVVVITILVTCAPLWEFTMGGKYKVLAQASENYGSPFSNYSIICYCYHLTGRWFCTIVVYRKNNQVYLHFLQLICL
jgi:hypothetical protein